MWSSNRVEGFVFIIVLIFLQLMALLSFTALSMSQLAFKLNQVENKHFSDRQTLINTQYHLIHAHQLREKRCLNPLGPDQLLARQSESFWQLNGCHAFFTGGEMYYLIDLIGKNPCERIEGSPPSKPLIAAYYRLTSWIKLDEHEKMITESTFLQGDYDTKFCSREVTWVKPQMITFQQVG